MTVTRTTGGVALSSEHLKVEVVEWYYVAATNSTEARKLIKQGRIKKIMWDTGATVSIVGLDHEDMITDKRPSRMLCKGAFDTVGNRGKSHGILKMWAISDPSKKTIEASSFKVMQANSIIDNLEKCTETFAGMTLAELMKDQLVKDECPRRTQTQRLHAYSMKVHVACSRIGQPRCAA